jgi:NAD(P)-dependent dehydrogenase (short-subunit alcohol dehydrogenase family)
MPTLSPIAVVTGAGSGIGRAVVLKLAAHGWRVALVGRRAGALAETVVAAALTDDARLACFPCDVSDPFAVQKMVNAVSERFGEIDALINSAAVNTKRRSLDVLGLEDYTRLIATNLNGAYYCVQAFLPAMRRRGAGTIVNINSEAGRVASAKSGPAYVMAKFGLAGLTQSINAEERQQGIRACSIFPGDVNTPLMDERPQPPPLEARLRMVQPEDVAACVWLAITLPARAIIEELVIRPP